MSITTFIRRSLPARAASAGLQAARTGIEIGAIPVREGVRALTGDLPHETLRRRCWRGNNRAWIEVRGLADDADGELGRAVFDALRGHPGVTSASLNHPLSRVVVGIGDPGTSLRDLCRLVETAERREKPRRASEHEAAAGAGATAAAERACVNS
ncbi:heavy-metal-associated domain-containing protein, partial [Mycobacterium alsense]|uniref:heavy-metal-associated domain-containing protein n=1 Tax=Mycobacterium alsense TaxID=324058 RepID=UPI0010421C28